MNFADILRPGCALFLDFDGSLVDIALVPEDVVVPDELVATLTQLSTQLGGAVALISGRPLEQIDAMLQPLQLPAAGVHGAEHRAADGTLTRLPSASLAHVESAARILVQRFPTLRLEHKHGAIALHYREAPELESACMDAMEKAVGLSTGLALLRGKMVVEAKSIATDKGKAIDAFMSEEPFKGRTPVFIGDDITDESGFAAVQEMGGVGIKVGDGETVAQQRIPSPAKLREQLHKLVAPHIASLPRKSAKVNA